MRTIPNAVWVDTTNLSALTRYYPNPTETDGLLLLNAAELTLCFDVSGGVTLTVEWCGHIPATYKEIDSADWLDITDQGVPVDGTAKAATYVDAKDRLVFKVQPGRVRVKIVTADGGNAVQLIAFIRFLKETSTTSVASSALPTGAATEVTLSAAEVHAGNIEALSGGERNSTTPDRANASQDNLEVARDGSLRINADCSDWSHQRHIVASTAAQQVACVRTAPAFAFDGLWCDQDGVVVFGQPRGRPYHVVDGLTLTDPTKWTTAGTDWTAGGAGTLVHAAGGGGTDTLVGTMGEPLVVGKTYLVYCKGTKASGTSATVYVGTAAGTAITANGAFEFVQALVCTGGSSNQIVATDDCAITFTAYQIYPHTPKLAAYSYMPFAMTEVLGAAAGSAMTTLLIGTTNEIHGVYRRKPGVADLG